MYQMTSTSAFNGLTNYSSSWSVAPINYSGYNSQYSNISVTTAVTQDLSYSEVAQGVQVLGHNVMTFVSTKINKCYQNLKKLFIVENNIINKCDNEFQIENTIKPAEVIDLFFEEVKKDSDLHNVKAYQKKFSPIKVEELSDDELNSLSIKIEKSLIEFYCDMEKTPPDCSEEVFEGKDLEYQNTLNYKWIENRERVFLERISAYIVQSIQEARALGKPLMLLLGENHYGEKSKKYESILVKILSQHTKVKSLLTEPFYNDTHLKIALDNNLQYIPVDYLLCFRYEQNDQLLIWVKDDCVLMRKLLSQEQLQKHAKAYEEIINSPESLWGEKMATEKAIAKRNEAMSELSYHIDLKGNGDTALIVGERHNDGLINLLSEHFHVVPFYLEDLANVKNPIIFREHEEELDKNKDIQKQVWPMYSLITSDQSLESRKGKLKNKIDLLVNDLCESNSIEVCEKINSNIRFS